MVQRDTGLQSQMARYGRSEQQAGNLMAAAARALAGASAGSRSGPDSSEELLAAAGDQYLIFSLLDKEFAIPAEYIQGVERLAEVTPVPNVASWVSGVINLRGSICSVVDLRSFLDMEQLPYNPRTRLLSVKYNEMLICLVVDSVSEMVPIQPNSIEKSTRSIPQWVAAYTMGLAVVGKRSIILLDTARLLFADKMHHYSI
jgi:purine-binding chemotaxis protein CheW